MLANVGMQTLNETSLSFSLFQFLHQPQQQQQRMQWSTKEMQRQLQQLCVSSQQGADEALSNIHTAEEKI